MEGGGAECGVSSVPVPLAMRLRGPVSRPSPYRGASPPRGWGSPRARRGGRVNRCIAYSIYPALWFDRRVCAEPSHRERSRWDREERFDDRRLPARLAFHSGSRAGRRSDGSRGAAGPRGWEGGGATVVIPPPWNSAGFGSEEWWAWSSSVPFMQSFTFMPCSCSGHPSPDLSRPERSTG